MVLIRTFILTGLAVSLLLCMESAGADEIRVAVASNFRNTARTIADRFLEQTGHNAVLISGSSGKHFAQINQGAEFDVLLSADAERPLKLEQQGRIVVGSRVTYAIGRLVLWSTDAELVDDGGQVLSSDAFRRLAIANPRHAPYGMAAKQVLQGLGLSEALQGRIVRGASIEQAFQFVSSGNAELGFVARAQLAQSIWGTQGSRWEVPADLHQPIEQQAVLLRDSDAGQRFMQLLVSPDIRSLIQQHGYDLPQR